MTDENRSLETGASAMSSLDVIATVREDAQPRFGEMSSPDGALTLLLCDLEDVEAIREELGPEGADELLRRHRTTIEQAVERHGGQVAKANADGFMICFDSAHAASHCAVDLQRSLAGRTAGASARPLGLRVGLHTGFVITSDSEFYGRNVVLAARIAARARGGEILVSSTLHEYTSTDPSFRFAPRGEQHFKGVLGEHRLFALEWAEAAG